MFIQHQQTQPLDLHLLLDISLIDVLGCNSIIILNIIVITDLLNGMEKETVTAGKNTFASTQPEVNDQLQGRPLAQTVKWN